MLRDLKILATEGEADAPLTVTAQAAEELVYFAEGVGLDRIKIGVTTNVPRRVATIDAHSPVPVRLLGVEGDGRAREAALHREFARFRVRGEWFEAVTPLRQHIEQFASPPDS
jgi:hypothetical protein